MIIGGQPVIVASYTLCECLCRAPRLKFIKEVMLGMLLVWCFTCNLMTCPGWSACLHLDIIWSAIYLNLECGCWYTNSGSCIPLVLHVSYLVWYWLTQLVGFWYCVISAWSDMKTSCMMVGIIQMWILHAGTHTSPLTTSSCVWCARARTRNTHTHTHLKHNLRIYPEAQELPAQMDFGMRTYVVGTQELLLIHTHE